MSVRGLVSVVIGVVAFVVIDSLKKVIGALRSNPQMKNPLSQGNLSLVTDRAILS